MNVSIQRRRVSGRAAGLMVASAGCWGLATVYSKRALDYSPPLTLVSLQLLSSLLFLSVALLVLRHEIPTLRIAWRGALSGLLEPGAAYALGIAGLSLTSAANASMIGSTEPLAVVILAFIVFGVRTQASTVVAIAVAMVGIALVSASPHTAYRQGAIGDGLVVVATLFAALYVVLTSRHVSSLNPLPLAFLQQCVGLAFLVAVTAVAIGLGIETVSWPRLQNGIVLIAVTGIMQYAMPFWLYLLALREIAVGDAALFLGLIPVFGVAGAAIILDEAISPAQMAGCALIIGAITALAAPQK